MAQDVSGKQSAGPARSRGLLVVAVLMIVFGLAEVATGFTHQFMGLTTTQIDLATYLGVLLGMFYFVGGVLILTWKRRAALLAIVLLCGDVVGRVAMVVTGLYPVDSFRQIFAIVVGTALAAFFAVYVARKLKSFG